MMSLYCIDERTLRLETQQTNLPCAPAKESTTIILEYLPRGCVLYRRNKCTMAFRLEADRL